MDQLYPEKIGSEKKKLTIEAHPPQTPRYSIRKQTFLTIGYHDTNRRLTLLLIIYVHTCSYKTQESPKI